MSPTTNHPTTHRHPTPYNIRPLHRYAGSDGGGAGGGSVGGNPTTYTTWISYAAWQRSLVTGNTTVLSTIRDGAAAIFRGAYVDGHLRSSAGRPCWSQSDGSDAMEVRPYLLEYSDR